MKKHSLSVCSAVGMSLLYAGALAASPIRIDFTVFPGADRTLGTADDMPVVPPPGGAVIFSTEYAFLSGPVGVRIDSPCCENPLGIAAIASLDGRNSAVAADSENGPNAFILDELVFNLVSSADAITPVTARSIDIRFNPGTTGTIDFFNSRSDLRARFVVPNDGSTNVLYSDEDGLSRVVFNGIGGVNLFEFDTEGPLSAPSEQSTPEPGAFGLGLLGLVSLAVLLAARRAAPKEIPAGEKI